MAAAQRSYDSREHPDFYDPPRRRNRTITIGREEISLADVDADSPAADETEDQN